MPKKKSVKPFSLCEICHTIGSVQDLQDLLEQIVRKALEIFGFKGASIRLLDRRWKTLEIAAAYGLSEEYVKKGPVELAKSPMDQEVLSGNLVIVQNAQKDPRVQYPEWIKKEGIRSIICIPLKTDGRVLGVLRAYTTTLYKFKEDEILVLSTLARQASLAIENLQSSQRNQILYEVFREITSTLDLSEVLRLIVRHVAEAMKVKACSIKLLDESKHRMVTMAAWGLSQAYIDMGPAELENLPIDQEALRGNVVYIQDVTRDPRFRFPEVARKEGIVSGLCVPLIYMSHSLGVMRVYTPVHYEFDDDEKKFLVALANGAALAVNNALVYQRLRTLHLVASSVSSTLELQKVLNLIVESATKTMNAAGSILTLWNAELNRLELAASSGLSEKFLKRLQPVTLESTAQTLSGKVVAVTNLASDPNFPLREAAAEEGVDSLLSVPLKAKDHVIGVLTVFSSLPRDFSEDEKEFLCSMASQGGTAIENAKLYEHINKKYHDLIGDIFLWYDGTYRGMECMEY